MYATDWGTQARPENDGLLLEIGSHKQVLDIVHQSIEIRETTQKTKHC